MRRPMLGVVVAATAVLLTVTASAMARDGDRTLGDTYPVATGLCVKGHAGGLPAKLEGKRTAVIAVCDTLDNAFAPLVSTVDAAEATYLNTLSAQRALVAAQNGLAAITAIANTSVNYLRAGGWLLFEHGYAQAPAVRTLLSQLNYSDISTWHDYAGHERVTGGRAR